MWTGEPLVGGRGPSKPLQSSPSDAEAHTLDYIGLERISSKQKRGRDREALVAASRAKSAEGRVLPYATEVATQQSASDPAAIVHRAR